MSNFAGASVETKSRSVRGSVDLGVCGGNEGLSVTVGESFRTLTCKCRCDVGVNGHLVTVDLSRLAERRLRRRRSASEGLIQLEARKLETRTDTHINLN